MARRLQPEAPTRPPVARRCTRTTARRSATYLRGLGRSSTSRGAVRRRRAHRPGALRGAARRRHAVRGRSAIRTSSAWSKTSPRSRRSRTAAGALAISATAEPLALALLRSPGRVRRRHRGRRGAELRPAGVLRRPGRRALRHARRVTCARCRAASSARPSTARAARLRAHARDARAAHPPRAGDVEHLHEPGPLRAGGDGLPLAARAERARAGSREANYRAAPRRRRAARGSVASARCFGGPFFNEFVVQRAGRGRALGASAAARGRRAGLPARALVSGAAPTRSSSASPRCTTTAADRPPGRRRWPSRGAARARRAVRAMLLDEPLIFERGSPRPRRAGRAERPTTAAPSCRPSFGARTTSPGFPR